MPRYRVIHNQTGETWEVEASKPADACTVIGWPMGVCRVMLKLEGPFAEITPPKIAKQITPPNPGSSHICPECQVSLLEADGQGEFWWQCPSCDLLYQEWENRYYRQGDL